MLLSKGDKGPPCGVPSSTGLTSPSSITPAVRNARISFNNRLSLTRSAILAISLSCDDPVEKFLQVQVHHPAIALRRYTSAPLPPPDAPSAQDETRSCDRKTSGPIALQNLHHRLLDQSIQHRRNAQAFAPLRPASGFPPASPVAAYRSRSATVPGWLASAVSGIPATAGRSCRPRRDSPCWP